MYHYGECLDISTVEFQLRKVLPCYEKRIFIPVDHHVNGKEQFDKFVSKNDLRCQLPLEGIELLDTITTSDQYPWEVIENELYNIYQIVEV